MRDMGITGMTRIKALGRMALRRRRATILGATVVVFLAFSVAGAFADAGNPIAGTTKATVVAQTQDTVTISVRGQWNWLTHGSGKDCNVDRAATGVGIIWNDTTEPGFLVSKNGVTAEVGVKTPRATFPNPVDQMVHPVDRGNIPEGYVLPVGPSVFGFPSGQAFSNPTPSDISSATWRGGCGRLPLTDTASHPGNDEASGQTCANGSTDCANLPWGSWGYETPYTHTYLKSALPTQMCVNFYDVHGAKSGNVESDVPDLSKNSLTVGPSSGKHNTDNSIESNAYNVNGNENCISVSFGKIKLVKHFIGGDLTSEKANLAIEQPAGTPIPGGLKADALDTQGTDTLTVETGSYSISESSGSGTNLADYNSTYSCTGNGAGTGSTPGALGSVTVGKGETVVCTFTNTLKPRLKVVKSCPSGAAHAGDLFQAQDGGSSIGAPLACGGDFTTDLTSDTAFSITEAAAGTTVQSDYTSSLTGTCSGTPHLGDALVTCTFVNELNPKLKVIKIVSGGTKQSADFAMSVKRGDDTLESFAGSAVGTTKTYTPGAYIVSENNDPLYTVSLSEGCAGTLVYGDDKTCTVTNTRKVPSITVEKSVSNESDGDYGLTASKPENGGTFYFKVKITNDSVVDTISVSGIADLVDGLGEVSIDNLTCPKAFPFTIEADSSVTCTFTRDLTGNAGATETDHVSVCWKDQEEASPEGGPTRSNDAIIELTDVLPAISVTKQASPNAVKDSGLVTFTAVVTNTSSKDALSIDTLSDSIYGDLITGLTKATCKFGQQTVSFPYTLPAGESLVCTFQAVVSKTETDTVTSSGTDEEDHRVTASANATVTVKTTPPPPPPAPKADVAIQKDATAQVTLGSNGKATIVYDLRVQNNGPAPAAGVTVSDPAPSGVTFSSVTQQPSQGSCSISPDGSLLSCTIGTLAVGQSVAIRVSATVTVAGTITNTGTTMTTTPETDPSNNMDSGRTLVVGRLTPPTSKPKPKPLPEICNAVTVTPKMLKGNGKAQKISVKVTQGKKGVAGATVKITGPGISMNVKSGKGGKVSVIVMPTKPGIIKVEIQNRKACNTQRIGVVGVFEPPVTG